MFPEVHRVGWPVEFPGVNLRLNAAPGSEHNVNSGIPAFNNKVSTITCWELSAEELRDILATGKVWVSIMAGSSQPPLFVGSETSVRDTNADYGLPKRK